jgi:apolipoprotein N-acyltransferase
VRWLVPLLVAHAGVMFALASPHRTVAFAWPFIFVPLFLGLDLALRFSPAGFWPRWGRVFFCTWPAGLIMAALTGGWVANTAFVYGKLPLGVAYLVSILGYGSLQGLEVFFFLGVPFALAWRRPGLLLALVPLWAAVFQLYVPRFLYYTFGQMMVPALSLVQVADLVGSAGLNLLLLPLHLVLYGWLRSLYAPGEVPRRRLAVASLALAVAFAADYGYGRWRLADVAERTERGPQVELVGIQPDFSLKELASNPALSYSDRAQSFSALMADSRAALARAQREPGVPTLVLWPESVYPRPYFFDAEMRAAVDDWVRSEGIELILATEDARFERTADGRTLRQYFGAAVHVGPQGLPAGVYHKITLIPFGETIPFGDLLPWYRDVLRAWIPEISEFTPGREYTVFRLADGVRVAPMICFDASSEHVARGMARNGANLGVVLGNLAWFGRTTVSDQFSWFARFRAIENRMPILFLSQNGESFLIDATGRQASRRLGQFTAGALTLRVHVPEERSFYTYWAPWVARAYVAALLGLGAFVLWRRRRERSGPRTP